MCCDMHMCKKSYYAICAPPPPPPLLLISGSATGNSFISNVRFRSVESKLTGDAEKTDRGRDTLYDRAESGMDTSMMEMMSLHTQIR